MADVFLSYKSQTRNFAEDMKIRLESWGYTVWWDQFIKAGENFVIRIREEIERAKAVVVVLSTHAIQSSHPKASATDPNDTYVIAEAMYAKRKIPIVPLVLPPLEPEDLPPPLNTMKTLRWTESEAIHAALKGHGVVPTNRPKPRIVYRQDVFTTGQPTWTEVDRSGTKEFQDLQAHLRMDGRIVRLYGATQTGKSVLARMALAGFMPIELTAGDLTTIDDFYSSIAIKYAREIGTEDRRIKVMKFLKDSRRPIIIDDFHRVPVEIQSQIIEVAKDLIQDHVNLVLISIPDCTADIIGSRAEFKNRTKAIRAPRWTTPQLRKIPEVGFECLQVRLHPKVIDEIVCQAHGNPHLVQEFCYELCEMKRIAKTLDKPTPVVVSRANLTSVFRKVGAGHSYDLMPILKSFAELIKVKWGTHHNAPHVSLPAAMLIVLDRKGAFAEVRALTIANYASHIVPHYAKNLLTERSILDAGALFIKALRAQNIPDTVVGQNADRFFIQHADFKVHLHWSLAPKLTHIQPQLEKLVSDYSETEIVSALGSV
jgi:hypothetical protein